MLDPFDDNFGKGIGVFFVISAILAIASSVVVIWAIIALVNHFT